MKAGEFSKRRAGAARQDRHASGNIICAIPCSTASCMRTIRRTGDKMVDLSELRLCAMASRMRSRASTHSICTLEFEDHRPLYEWLLDKLPVPSKPRQYEMARLNLTYTLLSSAF